MVRGSGSGSYNRNNSSRKGNSNTTRTTREGATAPRGHSRRSAAVAPEPIRSNHGSGSRGSTIVDRGSGNVTTTASESQRANHGSGTRRSLSTTERHRANHGSDTRRSTSTTENNRRANHGRNGIASSVSTITRESQRFNHGIGTRSREIPRAHHEPETYRGSGDRGNEPENGLLYHVCRCFYESFKAIFVVFSGIVVAILCCKLCKKATTDGTATTTATTNNGNSIHNHSRGEGRERGRSWFSPLWSILGGVLFSVLVFLVLIRNSATENLVSADSTYNIRKMFAGETQRIYLPILTRDVSVTVVHDPPTVRGMRAAVFKSRNCPSLNGPRVELQHDSELDLQANDFVYDYYNMNPGSSVIVGLDQISGGTYFYLLHGAKALKEIQTGTNVDPDYWERIAVAKSHDTSNRYFQTVTSGWDYDNIYTLVYDNESTSLVSSVDVKTDIVLTTHDLSGHTPICDHMRIGYSCRVAANRADCIIVEAFSVSDDQQQNERKKEVDPLLDENADSDTGTISVRIETSRNWKKIAVFSTIPLSVSVLVSVLIYICKCLWRWIQVQRNEIIESNQYGISTEPLIPPEGDGAEGEIRDRPPPMAPHHVPEVATAASSPATLQPTAPVEDDVGVVVIPPESVEVVTK